MSSFRLDTNFLVRVILRDDAEQVAVARSLLAPAPDGTHHRLLLSDAVVAELVWVLRGQPRPGPPRGGVADALEAIGSAAFEPGWLGESST